jgi:nucleoside-diphosphate-sugar epimerase
MKILISGANGFIGKNLTKFFIDSNIELGLLTRKKIDKNTKPNSKIHVYNLSGNNFKEEIPKIFKDFKPTIFIHAAAYPKSSSLNEINDLVNINITYSTQLAISSVISNTKFYNLSSYWQFSNPNLISVDNFYTKTKKIFEEIIDQLVLKEGLRATSVVLYDNFGPHDTRQKLFNELLDNAGTSDVLSISTPNKYINLLYISDVISGIVKSIENTENQRFLEVANPTLISLGELVRIVENCLGKSVSVIWEEPNPNLLHNLNHTYLFDTPQSWIPKYSLEQSIFEILKINSL